MSANNLTDRQRRVVRAMSHTYELAADIAHRAEVDNGAIGSVLVSLERREMVQRSVALRNRAGDPDLWQWRLR